MKKRNANIELLRIIAMCMVVAIHYMFKGMHLPDLAADASFSNHLWWLFYGLIIVSPNVYVLISGYFLCERWAGDWDWKSYFTKGISFWGQVLFYSWVIPLVLILFSVVNLSQLDFQTKLTVLFPISEEHYWFATTYLVMYFISPVLSLGLKQLNKSQYRAFIVVLTLFTSGIKSISPYLIPNDRYGCDVLWFVELFVIAAYIRWYGLQVMKDLKSSLAIYLGAILILFAENSLVAGIVRKTGKLDYFFDMIYCSNHIIVLIATVAFFCIFLYMGDRLDKYKISTFIIKVAPYSFGVYLLHENIALRDRWGNWVGVDSITNQGYQVLHMILCICVVMVAGICIDFVRSGIIKLVKRK